MMTSQIFKSVDFIKKKKFKYLEKETLFFLQKKKIYKLRIKWSFVVKNVAEVTFKQYRIP